VGSTEASNKPPLLVRSIVVGEGVTFLLQSIAIVLLFKPQYVLAGDDV
jgi:hypothetical protein